VATIGARSHTSAVDVEDAAERDEDEDDDGRAFVRRARVLETRRRRWEVSKTTREG